MLHPSVSSQHLPSPILTAATAPAPVSGGTGCSGQCGSAPQAGSRGKSWLGSPTALSLPLPLAQTTGRSLGSPGHPAALTKAGADGAEQLPLCECSSCLCSAPGAAAAQHQLHQSSPSVLLPLPRAQHWTPAAWRSCSSSRPRLVPSSCQFPSPLSVKADVAMWMSGPAGAGGGCPGHWHGQGPRLQWGHRGHWALLVQELCLAGPWQICAARTACCPSPSRTCWLCSVSMAHPRRGSSGWQPSSMPAERSGRPWTAGCGAAGKPAHTAAGCPLEGPPPEDPLQAPPHPAVQGVDECHGEDQQAGEAGSTESGGQQATRGQPAPAPALAGAAWQHQQERGSYQDDCWEPGICLAPTLLSPAQELLLGVLALETGKVRCAHHPATASPAQPSFAAQRVLAASSHQQSHGAAAGKSSPTAAPSCTEARLWLGKAA
ncbi:skin secretory protein xP2-like isoform X2 [Neopsephotus bourkii]|uniref:skin secretory protein xP2-like isoform X2 n=2 Tax=Neopsephotus bourkii TaxID=309878 RepID=UPI002AA57145|nr:skin secretory protein xP2-like isoform X2 [Neopsephotus bourkii]